MNIELMLRTNIAIVLTNLAFSIFFWRFAQHRKMFRENALFWLCAVLSYGGQALAGSNRAFIAGFFGLTVFSNLVLTDIIAFLGSVPTVSWFRWILSTALSSFLAGLLLNYTKVPFWLASLPIIASMTIPVVTQIIRVIRAEKRSSPMTYAYLFSASILALHQLDFPFLRLSKDFAPYGFLISIIYSISFGLIAPIAITEKFDELILNSQIRLKKSYQRFFPEKYLALLGKKSILDVSAEDSVEIKNGAILFSDLRNFTAITRSMSSSEVVSYIKVYLNSLKPLKESHGIVDKYIGDAVMVAYPVNPERALVEAKSLVASLEYATGIGIGFGAYSVGVIGVQDNLNISVFGNCVNEASRLCSFVKAINAKILVSEKYFEALNANMRREFRYVGKINLRGMEGKAALYECWTALDPERAFIANEIGAGLLKAIQLFEEGKFAYCYEMLGSLDPRNLDGIASFYKRSCSEILRSENNGVRQVG